MRLFWKFCVNVVRKALEWGSYMKEIVEILNVICKDVEKDWKWAIFGLGIHLGIQFRYSLFEV